MEFVFNDLTTKCLDTRW